MYKSVISIVLIIVLLLSVSACGNKIVESEPAESEEPAGTASVSPGPVVTEEPEKSPLPGGAEGPEKSPLPGGIEELTEEEVKESQKDAAGQAQSSPKTDVTEEPEKTDAEQSRGADLNIASPNGSTEYEKYLAMSGDEQQAFFESFGDPAAFFAWLNNARAEYEALYPGIEIGEGEIDLNDYIVSGN